MKIISTKHINIEDEKIAKQLNALCSNPDNCKDLLLQTLSKINLEESDLQKRSILNATVNQDSIEAKTTSSGIARFSKLKLYMPIAAVMILLAGSIFVGNIGFINNSNTSVINSTTNRPDGTVATTVSSITSESDSELGIENQLQAEMQTSIDDVYNSTKSFGEVSDEISL